MALPNALERLHRALAVLATGDESAAARLQAAWSGPIGELWSGMYLPRDLNDRFKQMWRDYTAPSDDRFSTTLRQLTSDEQRSVVEAVISLAMAIAAADARDEVPATA